MMIKILHVVSSLEYGGGVQTVLYNYHSHISSENIRFDFIVHGNKIGEYEKYFRNRGSKIYHVVPKKESLFLNLKQINSIIASGHYNIIHVHQNIYSCFSLFLGVLNKIPIRIAHSHGYKVYKNRLLRIKELPFIYLTKLFSNYKFACELEAGKWLFGKNWKENAHNKIMYNAIDLSKFTKNSIFRDKYREVLSLSQKFVILQVGRLSIEKNQRFSLDIIEELSKEVDVAFLVAGAGTDYRILRELTHYKRIDKYVKFLGNRKDISELMNAADVLLLPSINEGLGIVAIEAQASSLRVLASTGVPKTTQISNLIKYISLDHGVEKWIAEIKKIKNSRIKLKRNNLYFNNYSIDEQASKYEEWILNIVTRN